MFRSVCRFRLSRLFLPSPQTWPAHQEHYKPIAPLLPSKICLFGKSPLLRHNFPKPADYRECLQSFRGFRRHSMLGSPQRLECLYSRSHLLRHNLPEPTDYLECLRSFRRFRRPPPQGTPQHAECLYSKSRLLRPKKRQRKIRCLTRSPSVTACSHIR